MEKDYCVASAFLFRRIYMSVCLRVSSFILLPPIFVLRKALAQLKISLPGDSDWDIIPAS